MKSLEVEIPIEMGDKLYRSTADCKIVEGTVYEVAVSIKIFRDRLKNKQDTKLTITFCVNWGTYLGDSVYTSSDLNKVVFTSKELLIEHLRKN